MQIDEDKLRDARTLDLNHPPMKPLPYQEFPKCVYRWPADKSKEHVSKIVNNRDELNEALKAGWKTKPHIPQVAENDLPAGFEPEPAEDAKPRRRE